jgi:hypothetical protein
VTKTSAPPAIIKAVGLSPKNTHTHIDPSTVSKSIIKLTFDAVVWRDDQVSKNSEQGKIIAPVKMMIATDSKSEKGYVLAK